MCEIMMRIGGMQKARRGEHELGMMRCGADIVGARVRLARTGPHSRSVNVQAGSCPPRGGSPVIVVDF
jgi:hypothetical protein